MSYEEIKTRQSSQFKFDVVCIDCECSRRLAIDEYKRYVCDICNSDNIAIEGCELVDAVEVAHADCGELLDMVKELQSQVERKQRVIRRFKAHLKEANEEWSKCAKQLAAIKGEKP